MEISYNKEWEWKRVCDFSAVVALLCGNARCLWWCDAGLLPLTRPLMMLLALLINVNRMGILATRWGINNLANWVTAVAEMQIRIEGRNLTSIPQSKRRRTVESMGSEARKLSRLMGWWSCANKRKASNRMYMFISTKLPSQALLVLQHFLLS